MQSKQNKILGARIIAGGTGLILLLKIHGTIYSILNPSQYTRTADDIIRIFFGSLTAWLISPVINYEFTPILILSLSRAGIIMAFLLWIALKIIKGQDRSPLYNVMLIIGLWLLAEIIYSKFSIGFFYLGKSTIWSLIIILYDLSEVAIVIGIGIVYFNHNKIITEETINHNEINDLSKTEKKIATTSIPPDPILNEEDSMINASVNILGYTKNGWIEFIKEGSIILGFWVKSFPKNTTKKHFLSMFCAFHDDDKNTNSPIAKAHLSVLADKYSILPAKNRDGFDVLLNEIVENVQSNNTTKSDMSEVVEKSLSSQELIRLPILEIKNFTEIGIQIFHNKHPEMSLKDAKLKVEHALVVACPKCGEYSDEARDYVLLAGEDGVFDKAKGVVFGGSNSASIGSGKCPGCGGTELLVTFYQPRLA